MQIVQAPDPIWVTTAEDADALCQYFVDRGQPYSFDTETSSKRAPEAELIVWSISDGEDRYCLPRTLAHNFKPLWESDIPTIAWNAKYDLWIMHNAGIEIADPVWDGLVLDWLVDENTPHGLKYRSERQLGFEMTSFKSTFGGPTPSDEKAGRDAGWFIRRMMAGESTKKIQYYEGGDLYEKTVPIGKREGLWTVVHYASLDAWATQRIVMEYQIPRLKKEKVAPGQTYWDWFQEIEVPITRILWNMEREGFTVNTEHLEVLRERIKEEVQFHKEEAARMMGEPINLNSPKQLSVALFDHYGVDSGLSRKTASGFSTDDKTITRIKENLDAELDKDVLDFCANLIAYRKLSKILGTYIKPLINRTDPKTGRIRTILNQHITVTGRLSSSEPNLQQGGCKTA
jgi:DNA polymerase I